MYFHWILLADSSRARFFGSDELLAELTPVRDVVHPKGRLHTSELVSDDRGRSRSGPGGAQTAFDAHTDPAEHDHDTFARELAHDLTVGLDEGAYQQLVIAAPPRFLGLLRSHLTPRVAGRVSLEIDHELSRVPTHELPAALQRYLPT